MQLLPVVNIGLLAEAAKLPDFTRILAFGGLTRRLTCQVLQGVESGTLC